MKWCSVMSVAWISICVTAVYGDYIVFIQTHSYINPGSLLANGGCCDLNVTKGDGSCAIPGCDVYFYFCIRNGSLGLSRCRTSRILYNTERLIFPEPVAFAGLPNPLPLSGLTKEWNGVQFRLEVHEADDGISSGIVGLVTYNIALRIGEESELLTFNYPQLERSSIVLSFRVVCAENYYGRDCSRFCNASSCPCEPGYYGKFCQERDDCFGVNCGENRVCFDGLDAYNCECLPGFTGEHCEVNIDECDTLNVDCSGHGMCVDGINNYSCVCDSGFTGQSCARSITAGTDQDTNRGEAKLRVAAGVVGGLLTGGLILIAFLAILIAVLACIRKTGSGNLEIVNKTGHKPDYGLNNQSEDGKGAATDCANESMYMNVQSQNVELEHKFDNPIYTCNTNPDDNMYSSIGSVPDHRNETVTDPLEYKFENPIYGNESEAQGSIDRGNRYSRSIAPYETVIL